MYSLPHASGSIPAVLRSSFSVVALLAALAGCTTGQSEDAPLSTLDPTSSSSAPSGSLSEAGPGVPRLLTRLSRQETGIVHQNVLPLENRGYYLHLGAGVAAGDYDGDGLPDLYLVSQTGQNKLYRNLGNWTFEDVTAAAGVDIERDVEADRWQKRYPIGAYWFDYNNNRRLDLYVTAFAGANTLFRNNGDGTFTDVTEEAGVGYVGASSTVALGDYNRDGYIDMFVATYRPYGPTKFYPPGTSPDRETELHYDLEEIDGRHYVMPESALLYRNNGDGTFTDVTVESGIGLSRDWGLAASFGDVNNDGWPDLYVANDFETPDRFYLNNGDGTFTPVDIDAYRHTPQFSMGMDFGDINNDGWLDIMTSDMLSPSRMRRQIETTEGLATTLLGPPPGTAIQLVRNSLFLNNQDGTFSDIAYFAGVEATDWTWTVKFADMDLDGWQDLMVTNGFVIDAMNADERMQIGRLIAEERRQELMEYQRQRPPLLTPNVAFRNMGGLRFTNVSDQWGFNNHEIANGATFADLDGDGDLDVVVNNMNAHAGIYRNEATNRRIAIRLVGEASNSYGIGAKITAETSVGLQYREMSISGGYLSSHEPVAVFGLGADGRVERITVDWPSGHRSVLEGTAMEPSQVHIEITEPPGPGVITGPPAARQTQFEEIAIQAGIELSHIESEYDDYADQALLPYKLSAFGPGVSWGDANGNGRDDLYVAGSVGQPGTLFLSSGPGRFSRGPAIATAGEGLESQAALWWPLGSRIGLLESLSSAKAGVTGARGIARLLGVGAQGLDSVGWMAEHVASGGALAAADYDGDGRLDLFVAGRYLPGRYPEAVDSWLYRGTAEGTLALDPVNSELFAGLGRVTGALWRDFSGNGEPDLAVSTDYGPVHLFLNQGGRLRDATADSGLAAHTGWWTGIAAGDVNNNGHMDLVVANLGLNTRYSATPDRPMVLYAGALERDGEVKVVETEWEGDSLYPLRQIMDLGKDLPDLFTRYSSFRAYSQVPVETILGPERMRRATRLDITHLAHTLFLNDGTGRFTATPLPTEAQLQTGFGVSLADFDNDGHLDVYLVGNYRWMEPRHTGPSDSGVGVMLLGDGEGNFIPSPVAATGLSMPHDARGLAITDIDDDGHMDIAVGVNDGRLHLFRNRGVPGRSGLVIRLVGPPGNPQAIGARVQVIRSDGLVMLREIGAGGSFLSQDGSRQVFGLGEVGGAADVEVRWPDGTTQALDGVEAGALVEIRYP